MTSDPMQCTECGSYMTYTWDSLEEFREGFLVNVAICRCQECGAAFEREERAE